MSEHVPHENWHIEPTTTYSTGMDPPTGNCCLCGLPYWGYGHNPEPLGKHPDRACENCNEERVKPERARHWGSEAS